MHCMRLNTVTYLVRRIWLEHAQNVKLNTNASALKDGSKLFCVPGKLLTHHNRMTRSARSSTTLFLLPSRRWTSNSACWRRPRTMGRGSRRCILVAKVCLAVNVCEEKGTWVHRWGAFSCQCCGRWIEDVVAKEVNGGVPARSIRPPLKFGATRLG